MNRFLIGFTAMLLFPVCVFSKSARDSRIAETFRSSARMLPQLLLDQGYAVIGHLRPEALIEELPSIDVVVRERVSHARSDGIATWWRESAEWSRTGSIVVNGSLWLKTPKAHRPVLALHEVLGARGFSDGDFSCSSAIWFLTNSETRRTLSQLELASIAKTARSACVFAGGSTGVTGGGDDFAVDVKMRALRASLDRIRNAVDAHSRQLALEKAKAIFFKNFEISRRGLDIDFSPHAPHPTLCLSYDADVSTLKVWVNDIPVPQDPREGWSYDRSSRCITFHGRSVPRGDDRPAAVGARAQ